LEKGFVCWLTGLPGSGKTCIAENLAEKLRSQGHKVELLDGDWVRKTINIGAGYTPEERQKHLLRVAWIARLLARNGIIALCSFVSPYRSIRAEIRKIIEEEVPFIEVFVKCSLEEAMKRDPKGLYKRALKGEIRNMTGIDDPYEEPLNPEIIVDTEKMEIEECVETVLGGLQKYFLRV